MEQILKSIIEKNKVYTKVGKIASYIPQFEKVKKNNLGVYIYDIDGKEYCAGDYKTTFTMQGISKIISLMIALIDNGSKEYFSRLLNPMINSGAIAAVSLIHGYSPEVVFHKIVAYARKLTGNPKLDVNWEIYKSEKNTGYKNKAIAYFMKSNGAIKGNVEEILDIYFRQCAIEVDCRDIAKIGAVLANDGIIPWNGERIIPECDAKIVKSLMVVSGMHHFSGEAAAKVGIPLKSSIGGGILGAVPHRMGIGIFGPAIDANGNSAGGIKVLEDLSTEMKLSIF